jgi:hypothetical protein
MSIRKTVFLATPLLGALGAGPEFESLTAHQ